MKRILLRIIFFCCSLICFISAFNIQAENLVENELSFAVLTDVHIKEKDKTKSDKLNNALQIINKKIHNIDQYIFTGDYTNSGYVEEYNIINNICHNNLILSDNRIILMGNHDYWNGLDVNSCQNIFKRELKENLYSCRKVKGYTFISLSTENDYVHGFYSSESINFAIENIKASIKENKDKPIFVFTHQPPKDTVRGSDIWGNSDLVGVFDEYPQVILFAGHSHFPLNDEKSIYQKNYTVVNAGGIGGIDLEEGMIDGERPSDNELASQGLIIKVDKNNKVTIIKMDYLNNVEIKKPWVINTLDKSDFKYVEGKQNHRAPYFDVFSKSEIVSRSSDKVNIIFTQGKDDDMVYSYKAEIYEVTDKVETKVQEISMFSKFYLGINMPSKISLEITKINEEKQYTVKIFAVDCFGNISTKSLNCEIPKTI